MKPCSLDWRAQQDFRFIEDFKNSGMSRRKQSRPQHFDHDEKCVRSDSLRTTEAEFASVVTYPKSEGHSCKEKSASLSEMTQSEFVGGKSIEAVASTNSCEGETRKEMVGCNQISEDMRTRVTLSNREESKTGHLTPSILCENAEMKSAENVAAKSRTGIDAEAGQAETNSAFIDRRIKPNDNDSYATKKDQLRLGMDTLKNSFHEKDTGIIESGEMPNDYHESHQNSERPASFTTTDGNEQLTFPSVQTPNNQKNTDNKYANETTSLLANGNCKRACNDENFDVSAGRHDFTCIVCAESLPDVVTLQHHLLLEHMNRKEKDILHGRSHVRKAEQNKGRGLNFRKVSTVSPPQLSLLRSDLEARLTEPKSINNHGPVPPVDNSVPHHSEFLNREETTSDIKHNKKRGKPVQSEELSSGDSSLGYSNKKVKKDDEGNQRQGNVEQLTERNIDARRISCPAMGQGSMTWGRFDEQKLSFPKILENERYCTECDINFSSAANFRAHKQFYCASRHMQKFREVYQIDVDSPQTGFREVQNVSGRYYSKSHKRNVGNRSSMTPRKRSHLIPLETSRIVSPCRDSDGNREKKSHLLKSCPVRPASNESSGEIRSESHCSTESVSKKHFCEECNIWFSKYDTYIAHKKYYCESRRKDRFPNKSNPSRIPNCANRLLETNFRDSPNNTTNILSPEEQSRVSRENSPDTLPRDIKLQAGTVESTSSTNLQATSNAFSSPFPYFGHTDSGILARLSFMQPLILNQYISMMQQKLSLRAQDKADMYAGASERDILVRGSTLEKERKFSVDDCLSTFHEDKMQASAVRMTSRPNRQSCVAVINVKQEPDNIETENVNASGPRNFVQPENDGGCPLDLSGRAEESTEAEDCETSNTQTRTTKSKTTNSSSVKEEPSSDFPRDEEETVACGVERCTNGGSHSDKESADEANISSANDQDNRAATSKSRSQHCKNCDARFTSLSTFIAHKKYYCSATNSVLGCSEAKHVQLAH